MKSETKPFLFVDCEGVAYTSKEMKPTCRQRIRNFFRDLLTGLVIFFPILISIALGLLAAVLAWLAWGLHENAARIERLRHPAPSYEQTMKAWDVFDRARNSIHVQP